MFPKIKFNQKVVHVQWHENVGKWEIVIEDGTKVFSNVLVTGSGGLHVPNIPNFPGKVSKS